MSAGQRGFLDFVGYPVGKPSTAPACGYRGIVDWTGIPCGVPSETPVRRQRQGTGERLFIRRHDDDEVLALFGW